MARDNDLKMTLKNKGTFIAVILSDKMRKQFNRKARVSPYCLQSVSFDVDSSIFMRSSKLRQIPPNDEWH